MNYFTLSSDQYTTGFQEHASINLLKPLEPQLDRRRLFHRARDKNDGKPLELKKIIEHNASLRVDFGWSFESDEHILIVVGDALKEAAPKYPDKICRIVSDMRCSWVGFEPHNMYDKDVYKDLSVYSLIIYNNEIIDFQTEIIKLITNHPLYRQHALLRDEWYRFEEFKIIRKDRDLLSEKYHYYMKALKDISGLVSIPRDILESNIGTHFLYHPDLFFELLEFSILKGDVYG